MGEIAGGVSSFSANIPPPPDYSTVFREPATPHITCAPRVFWKKEVPPSEKRKEPYEWGTLINDPNVAPLKIKLLPRK